MSDSFVMYSEDEWSALYKNGKLAIVGDHYYANEYMLQYLKVDCREGDDFFLGGEPDYASVAENLADVEEYTKSIEQRGEESDATSY